MESRTLSIVIPCFNEEDTLEACVDAVLKIADETLRLEIIIINDASTDASDRIAKELSRVHPEVQYFSHALNQGKGAALRTGFARATGDYVAVQDADLEYDPWDLKRLLGPIRDGKADVVFGSRFLSAGPHRVLYFWHSVGNKFLTLLSNMFTDLNLTDMETCYKVFTREVIQSIQIEENRFGFEPEVVAKIAQKRLRVFEMGVSYFGRTYAQGKKIGVSDGFRAIYCILRYNANKAPLPMQFLLYLFIGGTAAIFNLMVFLWMVHAGFAVTASVVSAFFLAAGVNYLLCITLLFRREAQWNTTLELVMFAIVVSCVALVDVMTTKFMIASGATVAGSKLTATGIGLVFNFLGRRFLVFGEKGRGPWTR